MRQAIRLLLLFALGLVLVTAAEARAQSLGTLRWQLQPYCNVVTLSVATLTAMFAANGS